MITSTLVICALLYLGIAGVWATVLRFGIDHAAKALCAGTFVTCASFIVTFAMLANQNPFDFSVDAFKYAWGATACFSFLALVLAKPAMYCGFAFLIFGLLCQPIALLMKHTGPSAAYGLLGLVALVAAGVLAWKFRVHAKNWTLGGLGGAMVAVNAAYALLILTLTFCGADVARFFARVTTPENGDTIGFILGYTPFAIFIAGTYFGIRYIYRRSALIAASKV